MDITVRDSSQALQTGPVAGETPRRPLWPGLVIAFAISATMLWTGVLLWLLSRMIYFMVLWYCFYGAKCLQRFEGTFRSQEERLSL